MKVNVASRQSFRRNLLETPIQRLEECTNSGIFHSTEDKLIAAQTGKSLGRWATDLAFVSIGWAADKLFTQR
jgi:hypothetical protein